MGQQRFLPSGLDPTPQVVAVVMDMFTDVDLLSEVLEAAARRVPVYILLDEMNAQRFLDMADKCRVNLHHVDVSGGRVGCAGRGGDPWTHLTPLSPVPARAHCGRPHLLLPHWEVLQGQRKGEVPPGGLCRGDEWQLQVRAAPTAPAPPHPKASSPEPLMSSGPAPSALSRPAGSRPLSWPRPT